MAKSAIFLTLGFSEPRVPLACTLWETQETGRVGHYSPLQSPHRPNLHSHPAFTVPSFSLMAADAHHRTARLLAPSTVVLTSVGSPLLRRGASTPCSWRGCSGSFPHLQETTLRVYRPPIDGMDVTCGGGDLHLGCGCRHIRHDLGRDFDGAPPRFPSPFLVPSTLHLQRHPLHLQWQQLHLYPML